MDLDTHPSPSGLPAPADARAVLLPAPPTREAVRVGDLADEAAALHEDLRTLLATGAARDEELLAGLLAAEVVLERLRGRVARARPARTARCSVHLVRDARRSIHDACALVEDELARRSAAAVGALSRS